MLETERLILRRFCKGDLQNLYEYLSDAQTVEYEPYAPMDLTETAAELDERIESDAMIAVVLKENRKLIGNLYLGKGDFGSRELGYVFNRHYWRSGYAKESRKALIERTFAAGVHRIYAQCDPCNEASWRLLESLGFAREAHLKQNVYFWKDENGNPIWKDTFVYSLLNEE